MRTSSRPTGRRRGAIYVLGAAILWAVVVLAAAPASACPICHSETGEQVRAGIFGEDFGSNLLACVLPFPISLCIAAALHFGADSRVAGEGHPDSP